MAAVDDFDAVLWDNDGVLVDTEHLYYEATRSVMNEVGVTLDQTTYHAHFLASSRGAWHLVEAKGYDAESIERLKRVRDERHEALLNRPGLVISGVAQMLATLHGLRPMAVVTSSRRRHFDAVHVSSGLLAYFEFVLTREDYENSKPDPEPYQLAARRLGVAPERCLVVEDSVRGLTAAKEAGMSCWVVRTPLSQGEVFDRADRVLTQVTDVAPALLE